MDELDWQKPNSTELFALQRLSNDGVDWQKHYYPYPWATWIDRVLKGMPQIPPPCCNSLPDDRIRATVCQHIRALDHLDLFHECGITDLFWSHSTNTTSMVDGIRLHPFPLYPVRCATHPPSNNIVSPAERRFLYGFQGTYSNTLYLSEVRKWIFDLPLRSDALVERRDEWHFEQSVYREQVQGQSVNYKKKQQLDLDADKYAKTLQDTCFSLCPSGSGPNSIRLWESLGYGAIPVILSDTLMLPGDCQLWHDAALVLPETFSSIANLPVQLELIASDEKRLNDMQDAGNKLWNLYGLPGFITDLSEFLDTPLAFLTKRALSGLTEIPLVIDATCPVELPLLVRRSLRTVDPAIPLLITIHDDCSFKRLEIRWKTALRLCEAMLVGRSWGSISLAPRLCRTYFR